MMPGIDPRQMKKMMQQMGIKSEEIAANRVIIEKDNEKMILENPNVVVIDMQGQKSFQITSENIRTEQTISEDDVKLVIDQAGVSEEDAKKALEEAGGDVAEAIMKLKK